MVNKVTDPDEQHRLNIAVEKNVTEIFTESGMKQTNSLVYSPPRSAAPMTTLQNSFLSMGPSTSFPSSFGPSTSSDAPSYFHIPPASFSHPLSSSGSGSTSSHDMMMNSNPMFSESFHLKNDPMLNPGPSGLQSDSTWSRYDNFLSEPQDHMNTDPLFHDSPILRDPQGPLLSSGSFGLDPLHDPLQFLDPLNSSTRPEYFNMDSQNSEYQHYPTEYPLNSDFPAFDSPHNVFPTPESSNPGSNSSELYGTLYMEEPVSQSSSSQDSSPAPLTLKFRDPASAPPFNSRNNKTKAIPYVCPECRRIYSSRKNVKHHRMTVHEMSKEEVLLKPAQPAPEDAMLTSQLKKRSRKHTVDGQKSGDVTKSRKRKTSSTIGGTKRKKLKNDGAKSDVEENELEEINEDDNVLESIEVTEKWGTEAQKSFPPFESLTASTMKPNAFPSVSTILPKNPSTFNANSQNQQQSFQNFGPQAPPPNSHMSWMQPGYPVVSYWGLPLSQNSHRFSSLAPPPLPELNFNTTNSWEVPYPPLANTVFDSREVVGPFMFSEPCRNSREEDARAVADIAAELKQSVKNYCGGSTSQEIQQKNSQELLEHDKEPCLAQGAQEGPMKIQESLPPSMLLEPSEASCTLPSSPASTEITKKSFSRKSPRGSLMPRPPNGNLRYGLRSQVSSSEDQKQMYPEYSKPPRRKPKKTVEDQRVEDSNQEQILAQNVARRTHKLRPQKQYVKCTGCQKFFGSDNMFGRHLCIGGQEQKNPEYPKRKTKKTSVVEDQMVDDQNHEKIIAQSLPQNQNQHLKQHPELDIDLDPEPPHPEKIKHQEKQEGLYDPNEELESDEETSKGIEKKKRRRFPVIIPNMSNEEREQKLYEAEKKLFEAELEMEVLEAQPAPKIVEDTIEEIQKEIQKERELQMSHLAPTSTTESSTSVFSFCTNSSEATPFGFSFPAKTKDEKSIKQETHLCQECDRTLCSDYGLKRHYLACQFAQHERFYEPTPPDAIVDVYFAKDDAWGVVSFSLLNKISPIFQERMRQCEPNRRVDVEAKWSDFRTFLEVHENIAPISAANFDKVDEQAKLHECTKVIQMVEEFRNVNLTK